MVGTPDRKFAWLLSRELTIDDAILSDIYSQFEKLGFDTSKFIDDLPKMEIVSV
jgi:lipocalin